MADSYPNDTGQEQEYDDEPKKVGLFRGLTSIAFSLDGGRAEQDEENRHWETAEAVARTIAGGIVEESIPAGAFLNVNVPARPLASLRGIAVTRPAPGGYAHLVETVDAAGRLQRQLRPDTRHAHDGTDIRAIIDGYVSVSPLDTNMAHDVHARQLAANVAELTSRLAPS